MMTTFSDPFGAAIPTPENPPFAPDFMVTTNSDLPILAEARQAPLANDCWNWIGVKGDRSCSELPTHVHCRNCPVFTAAGQRLFDRELTPGHLEEWTRRLSEPEAAVEGQTISVLVFRIGTEWLAADVSVLVEIAELRPIHTIPHRSNAVLAGMVNIRGELQLCVSLGGILGIEMEHPLVMSKATTRKTAHAPDDVDFADSELPSVSRPSAKVVRPKVVGGRSVMARLMLITIQSQRWVFQVDEVEGVTHFIPSDLTNVPSTVSGVAASFSKGVFWQGERRLGFLDEVRLFDFLMRSLA